MIKQLALSSGDQTLHFQEGDFQYQMNLFYLEETGFYYMSLYKEGAFIVSNALRPFHNALRLTKESAISWMTLYDTEIDSTGSKTMDYSDMKEALGSRYRLLYLCDEEDFERTLFEDMASNTHAYYGAEK